MSEEQKAALIAKLEAILDGIDRTDEEDDSGWWETSTGEQFGAERLRLIRELVNQQ